MPGRQELICAPEPGSEASLGGRTVQTHVDGPRQAGVGSAAGKQLGFVEAVPSRNQDAELVSADGISAGDMMDARVSGFGELQQRGGQVGDMHRTAHLVCEQNAGIGAGGQCVHVFLVL